MLPEASAFDASWGGSSADMTTARVAYTTELAEVQFTPADFLNSEYGDTTTSNEDDTCVAFNLVTNRNSLVRESGGDGACGSVPCVLARGLCSMLHAV